jgi:hypothetical protein
MPLAIEIPWRLGADPILDPIFGSSFWIPFIEGVQLWPFHNIVALGNPSNIVDLSNIRGVQLRPSHNNAALGNPSNIVDLSNIGGDPNCRPPTILGE